MKVIEAFIIGRIQRGSKKGKEYIKNKKGYFWKVPEDFTGEIEVGDEVLVNTTQYSKKNDKLFNTKIKVLVIRVYDNDPEGKSLEERKEIIKILRKKKV